MSTLEMWDFPEDDEEPKSPTHTQLPNWDQLRASIDNGNTLHLQVEPERHPMEDFQNQSARPDDTAIRTQMDYLREQISMERKQRECAVMRGNAMRDSVDKAQKEAKAAHRLLAKEQALSRQKQLEVDRLGTLIAAETAKSHKYELEVQQLRCELVRQKTLGVKSSITTGTIRLQPTSTQPLATLTPNGKVSSASIQQQFSELTEAIMRIPVRQPQPLAK